MLLWRYLKQDKALKFRIDATYWTSWIEEGVNIVHVFQNAISAAFP